MIIRTTAIINSIIPHDLRFFSADLMNLLNIFKLYLGIKITMDPSINIKIPKTNNIIDNTLIL